MSLRQPDIDSSTVKALYPLSLVADHLIDKLIDKMHVELPPVGQSIIKRTSQETGQYHYLIEGEAEHRLSFDDRKLIACSDSASTNPLEEFLTEGGSIKAGEGCRVLIANSSDVEEFLSWSQSQEFKVVHMDEDFNTAMDESIIDDDFQDDWREIFLKSPLAANMPASTMVNMFSALEDIEFTEGEMVIKENTPGDCFYIIEKGNAEVITSAHGPFSGASFVLSAGDYFGDEALVADTTRNATVIMQGDGILGRLNEEKFNQIIKQPLMESLSQDDLKAIAKEKVIYLDVRLAAEFRHSHYEAAKNYPIAYIRKHLDGFDRDLTYVVTPECGRRGELAVYLLKQAGYQIFLLH